MFDSLLIANRGEIACRVIETARRHAIHTIAVYSDADAEARHVALADSAYRIGPAPARESYLDIDRLVDAIRRSGAAAVHPGYGFLSENAAFAEAVAAAGAVFVGPPPDAIRAMGSKINAKRIMQDAGVPLVPGYHGDDQDPALLAAEAERIGYPVLIKASAGGGGRGMRRVEEAGDFESALDGARREAKAGFGDDTVLIEKFVRQPRHIEMQVFADGHGSAVHLFERDCSIQRRHQKVVEEAPAPGVSQEMREAMGDAATAAARAIGYRGAGTVEFIVDGGRIDRSDGFFFMEMNTRLQVEHPVTEMITGLDLVEWQLRVAAGETLPLAQEAIAARGHALEVRLYAENPARNFMPQAGRLDYLRFPAASSHVRVDTGIREGDTVTPHYDPMIAKIIAWDTDRNAALRRMRGALAETRIAGITTNLNFLAAVVAHPAFAEADLETGFIDSHGADLIPPGQPVPSRALALAGLAELLRIGAETAARAAHSADPHSPWHGRAGWRLLGASDITLRFADDTVKDGPAHTLHARPEEDGYRIAIGEETLFARASIGPDSALIADIDGELLRAALLRDGDILQLILPGGTYRLRRITQTGQAPRARGGHLTAPMPGRVVSVNVAVGDTVKTGQSLIVMEAMKMEHIITAPADGTVAAIHHPAGDQVAEGAELLSLAPAS